MIDEEYGSPLEETYVETIREQIKKDTPNKDVKFEYSFEDNYFVARAITEEKDDDKWFLLKKQSFDLTPYKGKNTERWIQNLKEHFLERVREEISDVQNNASWVNIFNIEWNYKDRFASIRDEEGKVIETIVDEPAKLRISQFYGNTIMDAIDKFSEKIDIHSVNIFKIETISK